MSITVSISDDQLHALDVDADEMSNSRRSHHCWYRTLWAVGSSTNLFVASHWLKRSSSRISVTLLVFSRADHLTLQVLITFYVVLSPLFVEGLLQKPQAHQTSRWFVTEVLPVAEILRKTIGGCFFLVHRICWTPYVSAVVLVEVSSKTRLTQCSNCDVCFPAADVQVRLASGEVFSRCLRTNLLTTRLSPRRFLAVTVLLWRCLSYWCVHLMTSYMPTPALGMWRSHWMRICRSIPYRTRTGTKINCIAKKHTQKGIIDYWQI